MRTSPACWANRSDWKSPPTPSVIVAAPDRAVLVPTGANIVAKPAQDGTHGVRREPRITNTPRKLRQIFIALIVAANKPFAELLVPLSLYGTG